MLAPVAVLGQTTAAQQSFRALEQAWQEGSNRLSLEPQLRAFISQYPNDAVTRKATLWLGWLRLTQKKYDEAMLLAEHAAADAPGALTDAAQVLRAAVFRRRGQPEVALRLLEPLSGALVDSQDRDNWARETTGAAMQLRHDDDALKWALVWRLECSEDLRASVENEILRILDLVARPALERMWIQLEIAQQLPTTLPGRKQARVWMRNVVTQRLARFAIYTHDALLAQRLLYDPSVSLQRNVSLRRLTRIAARAETDSQSAGRKIGIILELDDPLQRRRSSEMVTGILQTLDQVSNGERAQLLTREASSSDSDGYEEAVAELYNEGAAIIIGGFDRSSSTALINKVKAHPLVLLSMTNLAPGERFDLGFWLDTSDSGARVVWQQTIQSGADSALELTDEDNFCTGDGDAPFQEWHDRHVKGLYLSCGASCAERLGQAAAQSKSSLEVWFGPKASASVDTWPPNQVAGVVAFRPLLEQDQADPALGLWQNRFGRQPHYFEALGHDVTVLTTAAMKNTSSLGKVRASRLEVTHELARQLLEARAHLWSSVDAGFAADHSLTPTFSISRTGASRRSASPAPRNHGAPR